MDLRIYECDCCGSQFTLGHDGTNRDMAEQGWVIVQADSLGKATGGPFRAMFCGTCRKQKLDGLITESHD